MQAPTPGSDISWSRDTITRPAGELEAMVRRIFLAAGSGEREAGLIAGNLVAANIKGHDSHGIGSIPVYIRNAVQGDLKLNAELTTILDTGAMLIVDGQGGAGQVMAHDAMAAGIERARQAGSCIVGLRNSHHVGRIGHWAEQCVAAGMASIHFVNAVSDPSVAPFGGVAARVGTNPFAVGLPRASGPIVIDFATSKLAKGKVRVAMNKGKRLPDGVLLTPDGTPTNDPAVLFGKPQGILLPFGDHKGWCMSVACELLAAALIGGKTQSHPKRSDAVINCMLTIIVSPAAIGTEASFLEEIETYASWVQGTPNDGVLLPGDPERDTERERLRDGIPVDAATWRAIANAARSVGVSIDGAG